MRIASGRVREIFKKLENGDGAAFFEHVADDVDWTVMGTHGIAINVNAATRQNGDASPVTATHCRPQDRRAFVIRLRDCFTSLFDRFFGEPRSESLCDIDVRDKG